MSLAETAHLLTQLDAKDNLSPVMAKAETSVARADAATGRATASVGRLERASKGASGAMTHFKGRVGDLAKGLGAAGLLGGIVGVTVAIKHGVDAAQEWGTTTDRLHQLTGASIEDASRFADAYDKLGISQDKQIRIMGFLSKTLGNYANNKKQARQVEKDYGFSLLDANGHMKNALTVTQDFTAYFNNKHIPSYQKASLGAKLFGRGWTDMIPVFEKGKKAMDSAMADAMHLDKGQVKQLHAWRDAQRDLNDSLGDLSVQIGLAVIPTLTELSRGIGKFVDEHSADIRDLFAKGLAMAKQFAGFVMHDVIPPLVDLGKAAIGFWNSIPGPLRDLITTGFVADRAIKFLFGFSPVGLAASVGKDVIGGAIKGIMGRFMDRGSPGNPLYVRGMDLGGGVAGGAAGKGLGALGKAAMAVEIVGMAAAVWDAWQTNIVQPVAAAQKDNAAKAAGILSDPTSKTRTDLVNMARLMREADAPTKAVIQTTSAKELQDALRNAGQNLVNRMGKDSNADILQGIKNLQESQAQAIAYGWTDTANALGADIKTLQGAVTKSGEHIGRVVRDGTSETKEMRRAQRATMHLMQVADHKGNRMFAAQNKRLFEVWKDAVMGDKENTKKMREAIHLAEREQVRALKLGHTKLAANLGKDITAMKAALAQKQAQANAKLTTIANKDTNVKVVTNVTSTIGVRSLESSQSVVSRYGRVQAF